MNLQKFDISKDKGFLPKADPLVSLSDKFLAWESLAKDLPKYLTTNIFRDAVKSLPAFNVSSLSSDQEYERAMVLLSYLGHSYVWLGGEVADSLPEVLAKPWCEVAKKLGRPPVLSYASYALHNWKRQDINKPIELGNIVLTQNFLGGIDEDWFVLIHIDIEAKAGPGIVSLYEAQQAVAKKDAKLVLESLNIAAASMKSMYEVLCRMPEWCSPYIYYNRVRPYIHGWKNHPKLPKGLIYQGVEEFQGKPQEFRGETGAQSGIVPVYDAALGIEHAFDLLGKHLKEMRFYMPPRHRDFLEIIEQGPSIRDFVRSEMNSDAELKDTYNEAVTWVEKFRAKHLEYAKEYILDQVQGSGSNPNAVGTGGTPFFEYLKKHRDETSSHLL